MQYAAFVAA